MALMITDVLLAFDHQRHEVTVIANAFVEDPGGVEGAYDRAVETIADVRDYLGRPVPALIVTADGSELVAKAARAAGIELMRKPLKPAQLRALLAHLLA